MNDRWDPVQYNRFAAEREQPFWDLAALVEPVERPVVVDLGCGDGRLTAGLHEMLGARHTLGIDSSAAMIAAAPAQPAEGSSSLLATSLPGRSPHPSMWPSPTRRCNGCPDHRAVLARWSESLRPGGQLAVQVPANADHPAHTVAAELAAELLAEPPPDPVAENVLAPEDYAVVLDELGFGDQHVRLQSTSTTSARHERWSSG